MTMRRGYVRIVVRRRDDIPPHPSGRPKVVAHHVGRSFWNTPSVGPQTPRLRSENMPNAIGFHAHIGGKDDQE